MLPFKPLGDADIHDALQLGMSEALIRKIGNLRRVNVKPLSSVGRYGGLEQDPADAGRELGADIVVDGSVQRHGDRLRIAVRLVDVASGHQLWSDRFDGDFTDIFVIQDTIAERAAGALLDELTMADRRALRRHPTEDAGAYQAYVVGWAALTRPGLGRTYLRMGDADRALEEFLRRTNTTIGSAADIAAAHALAGRRDEALMELHRLLDVARERYVSPFDVTTVYAALGDTRAALDWLERTWALPFVDLDPALDALRERPEFRPIVDRVMTRIRTFGRMRPEERAGVLREMRLSTVE